jgi:hypothetical protein
MTAMEKSAKRSGKRAAARIRAIRRKAAAWQRQARRAVAIALIAASIAEAPTRLAHAQIGQLGGAAGAGGAAGVGQGAMGSVGGLVNGAVQRLGDLEENGPGFMYYGINAADRGLGYRGSYYTVGGFVPYAEDDLGGVWNADLRGHLSNYGGFFSNIGAVRKQFWGGTLFGVGVFWDFDGDQNQYADTTITDASGSYTFAGGQTYQQVGVSAEWLTDYGNLRSNGYIPCGTTASTMGPFVGNSLLSQNGINAGLAGADLEVGAYIPGLADWAGMVSVGGYAFGNARYNNVNGTDLVPYFGGVYTRMDLTLIRNWDFSLQANNDSFFDWTGFARLTYRMGGSRRRNVPDQMEQPMMRNEHVVRAHQAPVQAINPMTGTPWRVIHVDNTTSVLRSGNGTNENPYTTLKAGRDNATLPFDVVYLHAGISQETPYSIPVPPANPLLNPDPAGTPPAFPNSAIAASYYFKANNQYLVGEGTSLRLNTVSHGPVSLSTSNSSSYPVIANAAGAAVILTSANADTTNAVVDHIAIRDSHIGFSDGPSGLPTNGYASVNDARIIGTGPSQRGVDITAPGTGLSTFNFTNMKLNGLTRDGFAVTSVAGTGDPQVNIKDSTIRNIDGSAIIAENLLGEGRVLADNVRIDNTSRSGVFVEDGQLTLLRSTVTRAGIAGLTATNASTVQVAQSSFALVDIGVQATSDTAGSQLNITISDNQISTIRRGNAIVLSTPDPVNGATIYANVVGNVLPANSDQDIVLFDGDAGGGGPGSSNLWIKASDVDNLRALNADASVLEAFPNNPTPAVPPPPNYNPALTVPLPPL